MMKMKKEVKHLGISMNLMLMVMVLFGSLFSSCYTKDDLPVVPPTESNEPVKYTVNVTVRSAEGPLDGVQLYPMNGETKNGGKYTYTQTGSGNVTFSLVKKDYEDVSYTVILPVAKNGTEVSLDATFYMKKVKAEEPATYTVAGKVFDGLTQDVIANANGTWQLRGSSKDEDRGTFTTAADGAFSVELPGPGVYDFAVTATGKDNVSYSVTVQKVAAGEAYYFNMEIPMYEEGTVEGQTYTINGSVFDESAAPLSSGIKVYYRHTDVNGSVDVEQEEIPVHGNQFSLENVKKGSVTLFVKSNDATLNGWTKTFELNKFSVGAAIPVSVYMTEAENGSVEEVVLPTEETTITIPTTEEDPTKDAIAVNGEIVVPEGALTEPTLIGAKIEGILDDAILASEEDPIKEDEAPVATFVKGEFLPEGLTFETPITWSVENPFKVTFNELGVQYSKDGKAWADVNNEVKVNGNNYETELEHFSHYRLVVKSTVALQSDSSNLVLEDYYVNKSGETIKAGEGKFEYTAETGYEYVTSIEEALSNAGLAVDANVVTMIKKAIVTINGDNDNIKKEVKTGTNNIDVPANSVYATTGKQIYQTKTYTFRINGQDVKVVIKAAKSVIVGGKVEPYDAAHHTHGGHITNGGAGGGSAE